MYTLCVHNKVISLIPTYFTRHIVCACSSSSQHCDRTTRKRSSADLGVRYPGDLVGQRRQRHHHKVLIKRNTIADFAVNKAYQASTASLISEQGTHPFISSDVLV